MKTGLKIIALLIPCFGFSQSFNELWRQKDVGLFGITAYTFEGYSVEDSIYSGTPDTLALSSSISYGLTYFNGWNFPVLGLGDNSSFGICPNIAFTVGLSGGVGMFIEAPVYMTLKYGTDATWNKSTTFDKGIGGTIGFGLQGVLGYTEAPIYTTGIGFGYLLPVAMAELSFVTRNNNIFKLRVHTNLGRSRSRDLYNQVGYPAMISYNQWGVSVIRTFYGQ